MALPQKQFYTAEDYWNLPDGERAELIDGQLYAMAPPSFVHQKLVSEISYQFNHYIKSHNGGCEVIPAPFAVNLDADDLNWVEPDISVICDSSKLTVRGCSGAPDLIVEIVSPSSQWHDCMRKLLLYQRSNIREYWIVNPITEITMVYDFSHNTFNVYPFPDPVPAGIFEQQLMIRISELLK